VKELDLEATVEMIYPLNQSAIRFVSGQERDAAVISPTGVFNFMYGTLQVYFLFIAFT